MAIKTWAFDLDGIRHTVQLEHGYFGGSRIVDVDGQWVMEIKRKLVDLGGDFPLTIAGHDCFVHIGSNGLTSSYDLFVDGISVTTGNRGLPQKPAPRWATIFAGACGILPILTLGGALPIIIGLGGAAACLNVARDPKRSQRFQVAACAGITLVAWVAVLGITFGLAILRTGPREFVSSDGRFAVKPPAAMNESVQSLNTESGWVDAHMFMANYRGKTYGVVYVDYPAGAIARNDPQQALDLAVSNSARKVTSVTSFTLAGNPAREYVAETQLDDGTDVTDKARFVLVQSRFYQIHVFMPKGQATSQADDFLQSFRLLEIQ